MFFEPSKEVTPLNGPRPAGEATECFYCKQQIGDEHAPHCVCRVKVVMVKVEVVIPRAVPASWDTDMIDFLFNGSSWCADNVESDLKAYLDAKSEDAPCLCARFNGSYLRDATEEDVEGLDLAVLCKR